MLAPALQAWIRRQAAAGPPVRWARLVFSAKEAAAKAWYFLAGRWFDLVELTVVAILAGRFSVRLTGAAPSLPATLTGRWLARDGLIVTAVAAPPA